MDLRGLYQIRAQAFKDPRTALRRVCREFEAELWKQVLKGFERTVPKSGLFSEGLEVQIYRDFYYQKLAETLTEREGSMAELLYRELSRYLPEGKPKDKLMLSPRNAEKGGRNG